MITLLPNAGLCNRMRAIDSALALSQIDHHPLKIYWEKNSGLNCRFCDLFEPLPKELVALKEVNRKPYAFYNYKQVNNSVAREVLRRYQQRRFDMTVYIEEMKGLIQEGYNFEELKKYRSVLIETHSRFFYPQQGHMYQHFKPLSFILKRIDEISEPFSNNTVGVHIRRADHLKSIKDSPLDLFIQVMSKEVQMNEHTNFFVASDDQEVKTSLIKLFGNKVIMSTSQKSERNTKSGIIGAVIDLYVLSRTAKVFGSYGSSFSHTACHISDIEEIIVKEDRLPAVYRT